jgi:hypothetical protein
MQKIEQFIGFFCSHRDGANQLGWGLYDLRVGTLKGQISRDVKSSRMLLRYARRLVISRAFESRRCSESGNDSYAFSSSSSALASFQIGGVETLGEPVVDFGEHGARLIYCAV